MSKPTTKLLAALRDDDGDTNDKLYRLAQVVRLAAFAAEAQRCLENYSESVALFPDCQRHIQQNTLASSNWTTHEVNIGDILTQKQRGKPRHLWRGRAHGFSRETEFWAGCVQPRPKFP